MSTNLDGTARNGGRLRSDAVLEEDRVWMDLATKVTALGMRDGLIGVGVGPSLAAGIAFWLEDQRRLSRVIDPKTVLNYRKILRSLDPLEVSSAIPG